MSNAPALSVVVPSYNSAEWLPSTLAALGRAVRAADLDTEVVVVDDGSVDTTRETVTSAAAGFPGALHLISQENRGRFLARHRGLEAATADWVLLLDSRVLIDEDALRHAFEVIAREPERTAWNAWVVTDPASALVGLFWEVPTRLFWGAVLRRGDVFELTSDTFDRAPKGTTMFLARTTDLRAAFRDSWPEGDAKLVSDDTKLLRLLAARGGIRLDPGFSAVYRPRTSARAFARHSLDRGTLFVDSYAGTTPARSVVILGMVAAPLVLVAGLLASAALRRPALASALGALTAVGIVAPVPIALRNGASIRAAVAFVVCLPVFAVPFWSGLVRGVVLHRRAFSRRRPRSDSDSDSDPEEARP